jgi:hypothetical protein
MHETADVDPKNETYSRCMQGFGYLGMNSRHVYPYPYPYNNLFGGPYNSRGLFGALPLPYNNLFGGLTLTLQ